MSSEFDRTAASFSLNAVSIEMIKQFGNHFPGGFFIYKAEGDEELLYANRAVYGIFGCKGIEEFKELTGNTFKGMLLAEDYLRCSASINEQIAGSDQNMDHVIYRIVRRDGEIRWIDDYGHYAETDAYGGVYYVFISDITEAYTKMQADQAMRKAVINALCNAYETVMLITDVRTEAIALYKNNAADDNMLQIRSALKSVRYTEATNQYIDTMVAPQDRDWLRKEMCIENVLANTASKKQFAVTYQRISEDRNRYYRVEFIRVSMPDGATGIIYGFKDVDYDVRNEQLLREQLQQAMDDKHKKDIEISQVQEAALKDVLTGVKNKRCFALMQNRFNQKVSKDFIFNFAVVVCDVNDLKRVNDSWGHLAGDQYIQDACKMICRVFAHSPVFRIGGDEFAVILTGGDYENRHTLVKTLRDQVRNNISSGGVIIASGLADYFNGHDKDFKSVFDRADQAMYANKKELKEHYH